VYPDSTATPSAGQPKPYRKKLGHAVDLETLALLDEQIGLEVFGAPGSIDIQELAEQTGWSIAQMRKIFLWAGLPHNNDDDQLYVPVDIEGLRDLKELSDTLDMDAEAVGSLVRSVGSAMERLALWQVESVVQFLAKRYKMSDTQARIEAAETAPKQARMLVNQIISLWLLHYARATRRLTIDSILQRGVSDDDQQLPLLRAIGYVQIADFHRLTAHYGIPEYAELVQKFVDIASDIIKIQGGRVIKQSGDSMLFVTDDIDSAAEIALALTNMQAEGFPGAVQVGLGWGRVFAVYGNVFGPVVTIANLLTLTAPLNGVYVDEGAAAMLRRHRSAYALEPVEVNLPGVGEVTAYHLQPL